MKRRAWWLVPPALAALVAAGCERETRHLAERNAGRAPAAARPPLSPSASGPALHGLPRSSVVVPAAPYPALDNAWAVSEGQRWYRWFNCNGCHASGGGDSGPALMDADWRYGAQPEQIVASILQGRPNGMPAFAGRVSDEQAWQLAAYVLSLGAQLRRDVLPSRADALSPGEPPLRRERTRPGGGDIGAGPAR